MIGFLKTLAGLLVGKKTYIIAAASVVGAALAWWFDVLPKERALEIIFEATGLSTLRAAISKGE